MAEYDAVIYRGGNVYSGDDGFARALDGGLPDDTCPVEGCDFHLPPNHLRDQVWHMQSEHPEVVAERQKLSARWDGWENG